MTSRAPRAVFAGGVLLCAVLCALPAMAAESFSFAVIPHPVHALQAGAMLRRAIKDTDSDNLAFVVANGIKAADEPCTDALYSGRRALLESAQNGVIVSPAASDWTACKDGNGQSAAIGRLSRLRELMFPEDFSFGASRIPLVRQSTIARFRSYGENARWEIDGVMFATIDLPNDNNHFLFEAGRNSEFEDRVIANRSWLHRIFSYARYQKLRGIVLFSDGNPLSPATAVHNRRDGYREIRRQLAALCAEFSGRVLVVHNEAPTVPPSAPSIAWHGRLGELGTASPWVRITVNDTRPAIFSITRSPLPPDPAHR